VSAQIDAAVLDRLEANPIDWLLERDNPCVRYIALTRLLRGPEDDRDVVATEAEVARWEPARRAIAALDGMPWDLDNLAKIGIPPGLPEVRRACERWLAAPIFDERPGREPRRNPGPLHYFSQYVGALARMGWHADPRLRAKVEHIMREQRLDDGNRPGTELRHGGSWCFGAHCCMAGASRSLWAVAGVPPDARTPPVAGFLSRGRAFIAAHNLFQANHHGFGPIVKSWTKLHLPFALGWHTDALDLLDIATELGLADDPCCVPALQLILGKQNERGRWLVEQTHGGQYDLLVGTAVRDTEKVGDESKWITAAALIQLARCRRLLPTLDEAQPTATSPALPAFADYGPPDTDDDERRVRSEWAGLDTTWVLEALLDFARDRGLPVGWHWGLMIGPAWCREWLSARPRKVPARNIKDAWPVARVCFLALRGVFTPKALSARLRIPLQDEYKPGERSKRSWIDATLWRVAVAPWNGTFDEVGIAVREPDEVPRLVQAMAEALDGLVAVCAEGE